MKAVLLSVLLLVAPRVVAEAGKVGDACRDVLKENFPYVPAAPAAAATRPGSGWDVVKMARVIVLAPRVQTEATPNGTRAAPSVPPSRPKWIKWIESDAGTGWVPTGDSLHDLTHLWIFRVNFPRKLSSLLQEVRGFVGAGQSAAAIGFAQVREAFAGNFSDLLPEEEYRPRPDLALVHAVHFRTEGADVEGPAALRRGYI